jgi:hypothetical protein
LNVAPDAASIAVTRLFAWSQDALIRPFVEQVSREPRLRDPETNTYGGLYLWADQEAYERYIKGDIFNAIKADQNLENVESRDFGVFDDLSSITMPKLRVDA